MDEFRTTDVIYENALASEDNIVDFRMEGQAEATFTEGRMRLTPSLDPELGQAANFVLWCPEDYPADVRISWDYHPIREPGLSILFFSATGAIGQDLFDESLKPRAGEYQQYHSSDINALHVSYFRRKHPHERAFQTCNLRKSAGFHLVAKGADPLPSVEDARPPYLIELTKCGPVIAFAINDLPIFRWVDDGNSTGPVLGGGKIGFRQMAPLIAEYANLKVEAVEPA